MAPYPIAFSHRAHSWKHYFYMRYGQRFWKLRIGEIADDTSLTDSELDARSTTPFDWEEFQAQSRLREVNRGWGRFPARGRGFLQNDFGDLSVTNGISWRKKRPEPLLEEYPGTLRVVW